MKKFVEQYNENAKFRIQIAIWNLIGISLPYLPYIKDHYHLAFGALIIQIITMAMLHWIVIRAIYNWRKKAFDGSLLLTFMTVVYFIFGVLAYGATPYIPSGDPQKSPDIGIIYVTHRDDCPFCNIAIGNVKSAIAVHNGTHLLGPKIRLVNINDDTPLAKEVSDRVEKSGSIYYQPSADKMTRTHYTRGDGKGRPIALTSNEIYQLIRDVMTHNDE